MATNSEIIAFMELFGSLAIAECNRRIAAGKGFILPSVAMAQSALESDWGQAGIMKKANAFFGVKAGGSWPGKIYSAATWEVVEGEVHNITANFRAYNSPAESMADYYELTCSLSRYANGISYGTDRTKWLTAKETITALWKGGYASDELYVNKIMNTINGRDLTKYDALITGEGEPSTGGSATPTPTMRNYTLSKNNFVAGQMSYNITINSWNWSAYSNALTNQNNIIQVENSALFTLAGLPENTSHADLIIKHGNSTNYSTKDAINGATYQFEQGDEIAINLYFKSTDFNNLGDFTLIIGPIATTNNNAVLAYFVKIE